jgi:hypothetical protein
LDGTHDAEQRSGISGKNLMGRREVNDIRKEKSLKETQGSEEMASVKLFEFSVTLANISE